LDISFCFHVWRHTATPKPAWHVFQWQKRGAFRGFQGSQLTGACLVCCYLRLSCKAWHWAKTTQHQNIKRALFEPEERVDHHFNWFL
jgi:hypothetical protein